jgi:hypothetical protein
MNNYKDLISVYEYFNSRYEQDKDDERRKELRNKIQSVEHEMFITQGESQE